MNYFDMNATFYKISNRTIKISKKYIPILDALKNGKYYNIEDLSKLCGFSSKTVLKILKECRLRNFYNVNKCDINKTKRNIISAINYVKYEKYEDIANACNMSKVSVREIINNNDDIKELYYSNISDDSTKYIKIINTVNTCSYSNQKEIARICGCSPSYVSSIIQKYNMVHIYYSNRK